MDMIFDQIDSNGEKQINACWLAIDQLVCNIPEQASVIKHDIFNYSSSFVATIIRLTFNASLISRRTLLRLMRRYIYRSSLFAFQLKLL